MKSLSATIQIKATEQYFPVGFYIILYKVVLTFESVDEIPKSNHSNESIIGITLFSMICEVLIHLCKRDKDTTVGGGGATLSTSLDLFHGSTLFKSSATLCK